MVTGAALAGAAVALGAAPAYASTLNGTATITDPSLNPISSGGSTTQFSVALPANAACTGDTATGGYHVYSYLVPSGTAITGITFTSHPSEGLGLVNDTGVYYGPANTAINTGQIISIPTNFEWAPLLSDGLSLSQLLYTGGTSGVWEAGLACANSSGVLTDYWNVEVTFTSSQTDGNGFVWSVGPPASTPEVPVAAALPAAGLVIFGGSFWLSRRRSARKVAVASHTTGT
ncbi:MAG: hypothetical protein ABSG81_01925 [Acidimicrobiales bacterium]|jgi:hypothetical protein